MAVELAFQGEKRKSSPNGPASAHRSKVFFPALLEGFQQCLLDLSEGPDAFLERDPAARSRLEVALLYPGLRALLAHRLAHALWRAHSPFLARAVSELSRSVSGIEIHPGAIIGRRLVIDHGFGVVIGETAVLEDDVTLYQGVTLGAAHVERGANRKRHPTLRKGASVGVGASVLGNITIGEGARVGAGAVVLVDVEPGDSVGGIPAVPLKSRRSSVPPVQSPPAEKAEHPEPVETETKAKKGPRHAR